MASVVKLSPDTTFRGSDVGRDGRGHRRELHGDKFGHPIKDFIPCSDTTVFGSKFIELEIDNQLIMERFNQSAFSEQNLVGYTHQRVSHIVFDLSEELYPVKKKTLEQSLSDISLVCA